MRCRVRIRHRQALQHCLVDTDPGGLRIAFDTPQRAISPGQFVVFYRDDDCLGGSVISRGFSTDSRKQTPVNSSTVSAA
jgi:tRNA-specific 2-thiouridylase